MVVFEWTSRRATSRPFERMQQLDRTPPVMQAAIDSNRRLPNTSATGAAACTEGGRRTATRSASCAKARLPAIGRGGPTLPPRVGAL